MSYNKTNVDRHIRSTLEYSDLEINVALDRYAVLGHIYSSVMSSVCFGASQMLLAIIFLLLPIT